jgi:hypothetical protein
MYPDLRLDLMKPNTAVRLYSIILCLALGAHCGPAAAQMAEEVRTITVVGSAALTGGNIPAAREAAIASGLKQAVAAAAVEIANPEGFAQNFKTLTEVLLENPEEYILGFRVLSEAPFGRQHRVLVQAAVSTRKVREAMAEAGMTTSAPAVEAGPVTLTVEGSGNLPNFVKLRRALSELPGVQNVQVREMKPNEAILTVDFAGRGHELGAALALHTFDTFQVVVIEATETAAAVALNPK